MQTQITRRCVIEEEIEELGEKSLRRPPSGNQFTRQSVRIYGLARDPPSSYSNKTYRNRVVSSSGSRNKFHVASAILDFFQCFPATQKTLTTL